MNVGLVHAAFAGDYQALMELNDIFEENNFSRIKQKSLADVFYKTRKNWFAFIVPIKDQEDFVELLDLYETNIGKYSCGGMGYFHVDSLYTKAKKRPKFRNAPGFITVSGVIHKIALSDPPDTHTFTAGIGGYNCSTLHYHNLNELISMSNVKYIFQEIATKLASEHREDEVE